MKYLLIALATISSFTACQRPPQAYFQRSPSIQKYALSGTDKQTRELSRGLSETTILPINAKSEVLQVTPEPQLEASIQSVPVFEKVIIRQKLKSLPQVEKILAVPSLIKKSISKPVRNEGIWDGWDKNLKLGTILTGLLILLALLGVGGIALGIVALFALWYLVRGLKRTL